MFAQCRHPASLASFAAVVLALASAGGCTSPEPPRVSQIECVVPKAVLAAGTLVLLMDNARREVTFANLLDQPVEPVRMDRFSYTFLVPAAGKSGGGPMHVRVGRFDGALQITRAANGRSPALERTGSCKSVTPGPKL
jgi:hypothetical protein